MTLDIWFAYFISLLTLKEPSEVQNFIRVFLQEKASICSQSYVIATAKRVRPENKMLTLHCDFLISSATFIKLVLEPCSELPLVLNKTVNRKSCSQLKLYLGGRRQKVSPQRLDYVSARLNAGTKGSYCYSPL